MAEERRFAPLVWGTIFVLANVVIVAGYWAVGRRDGLARNADVVLAADVVEAPAMLSSEADQIAIAARVDAPLKFTNVSDREQSVAAAKTGCSCYGVATNRFLLEAGEQIRIAPGASRDLYFVAKQIEGEAEQTFRVRFSVGGAVDASPGALNREITATCSLKIVPDLVLEPASVVVDLPASGDSQKIESEFPITLKQVTRGRRSASAPKLVMNPELLKASEFKPMGQPKEILPGLWQSEWSSTFSLLELPDMVRENGGRFVFSVEFEDLQPSVVEPGQPRRAMSELPTLLEVVRDEPQHRVSGHLVVRRSRGVVAPGEIHFGSLAAGERRDRRIVLTAADKTPFTVEIKRAPDSFEVAFDSTDAASQQWLTLTSASRDAGEIEELLVLRTSHPDQPELRVRLKARVRQREL